MLEFKTIESERYEKMEDGIHVKHVGMIKAQDAFNQLEEHLKKVGLLPDEYFLLSHKVNPDTELPDFATAVCHTDWGGSEGIYIDIDLKYYDENHQIKFSHLATGKTLGSSGDDFIRMSRIAAECSMMLNGRGCRVRVSENQYENTKAQVDLGFAVLTAEKGNDPNYKEVFIGLEDKDGCWSQDIAVVGGKYHYENNEIIYDKGVSVKVYSDEYNEDYTHDFSIGIYDEKEQEKPSLSAQIHAAEVKSTVSSPNTAEPTKESEPKR